MPYRKLHGSSRPDTALCPLISRGWWPVGPVRRLRELSHCRQLGSSWPGLQPRCSSIGWQGSPVPMRWAIAGPRLSPPWPVAPKPRSSLRRSVGPTHACQTAPSEHVDPPGLPHKLLLGTSSHQIANAYLGGNLSLAAVLHYIAFGGSLGSGHSRLGALPQDSTPTTYYHTRQIRITFIVLVDVSVKSWNIFLVAFVS